MKSILDVLGLSWESLRVEPPILLPLAPKVCYKRVLVHFATEEDARAFEELFSVSLRKPNGEYQNGKVIWWPPPSERAAK